MVAIFEEDFDGSTQYGYEPQKDLNLGWHFSHTESDPGDPLKTVAVLTKGTDIKLIPY